ncbi:conserved hypothetical protein [Xanthomonas campestris pv. campestris str. 8004]|uniref:Uncharacterized protein n=1 Tax=Xanthomonas campestris pv. campestris (strain 8004) TaxID=314565 RepID=A0A0H2X9I2_XANC8|nr:conserved hypothetical protein [Xanthomonas campestris pv. campestris str. 8004]
MGFLCLHPAGASRRNACVGRAANTTPARGIRPPAVCGFEPPDIPSPLVAVLGLFQEGVAMSTAPSMPASVPVDLLPASAHRLRWDMGDVLRRLDASTAIESPLKNPLQAPSVIGDSGTALKDGHPIARIQARKNAIQRSSQRRL